jgi:hypothetical protein
MGFPDWMFTGSIRRTVRVRSSEFLSEEAASVQLVITSPPDLSESNRANWSELFDLYESVFIGCVGALAPNGVIAVVVTNRKWKGTIVAKDARIAAIFESKGMRLFAHKILVRTWGVDLYRMCYSHLLCFWRKGRPGRSTADYRSRAFRSDIWGPFDKPPRVISNPNSFAPEVVKRLVLAFSHPADLILDPFCGAGTTQRVALGLNRRAKGYEANADLRACWKALPVA